MKTVTAWRRVVASMMIVSLLSFTTLAQAALSSFCWADTYGRGVGTVPDQCGANEVKDGLLCYPKCTFNGTSVAGVCWQGCPAGSIDDGAFCRFETYGNGAGYVAWDKDKCFRENSQGCFENATMWYPNCRAGFHHVGGNICEPDVDCAALGMGPKVINSCTKITYVRAPISPGCGAGKENDAGLCYTPCGPNADGEGPLCKAHGPAGWVECGAGYAADQAKCTQAITDQVLSVFEMAASTVALVGSFGASAAAVDAAKTGAKSAAETTGMFSKEAWKALQNVSKDEVKNILKDPTFLKGAGASYGAGKVATVPYMVQTTSDQSVDYIWQVKDLQNSNASQYEKDIAASDVALNTIALLDPTGVAGAIAAYTKPLCSQVTVETPSSPATSSAPSGALYQVIASNQIGQNLQHQQAALQQTLAASKAVVDEAKKTTNNPAASPQDKAAAAARAATAQSNITATQARIEKVNAASQQYATIHAKWQPIIAAGGTVPQSPPSTASAPIAVGSNALQWQLVDGRARDVGVGADGSVWVIGTGAVPGGYEIYRRGPSGWVNVPGGAERIAVDPKGHAWVVNNSQTIFRYDGSKWVVVNGQARDVGIGANGTVWVIGNNQEAGGYGIYRTTDNGANWTKIPGSALRIAVDPTGNAWVVNNSNTIFRYDGTKWIQTPGAAKDVGVGADGAVWVIGTDDGIYRWNGSNWTKKTGGAQQISAGPGGVVWVVNAGGEIYKAQD